jgi:hypothetical protein
MHRRLAQATLALAALTTLLGSAQAAEPGKKYAVLVGVEDYQHPSLRRSRLLYSIEDVTELADLLRKAGYAVALLGLASLQTPAMKGRP